MAIPKREYIVSTDSGLLIRVQASFIEDAIEIFKGMFKKAQIEVIFEPTWDGSRYKAFELTNQGLEQIETIQRIKEKDRQVEELEEKAETERKRDLSLKGEERRTIDAARKKEHRTGIRDRKNFKKAVREFKLKYGEPELIKMLSELDND